MTTIERWSETTDGNRDAFRLAFLLCAPTLRGDRFVSHAPSPKYAELMLRLAGERPMELYLARDGGTTTGRALVASALGGKVATIGLVELAAGDAGVAAAREIVSAAGDWAESNALQELIAPVDLNTWFTYRFLLPPSGPVAPPPFAWEPAQPEDYPRIFEQLGFAELERYQTLGGDLTEVQGEDAAAALAATEMAFRKAAQAGFTFHRLESPGALGPLLDELHPLCMESFKDNLLFEPIPLSLFRSLYAESSGGRDASLTHWVRDGAGRLAGFVLAFVDGDTAVVKTIAVTPELRGKRISSALVHLVLRTAVERRLTKAISALVRRGNTSENLSSPYLMLGVTPWKREYVLLRRVIGGR